MISWIFTYIQRSWPFLFLCWNIFDESVVVGEFTADVQNRWANFRLRFLVHIWLRRLEMIWFHRYNSFFSICSLCSFWASAVVERSDWYFCELLIIDLRWQLMLTHFLHLLHIHFWRRFGLCFAFIFIWFVSLVRWHYWSCSGISNAAWFIILTFDCGQLFIQ